MEPSTTSQPMGRRSAPEDKRVLLLAVKISARERRALDALYKAMGGEVPARESDAVRLVLAQACGARGIEWPDDLPQEEPDEVAPAPERVIDDSEAQAPPKRGRR